MSTTTMSHATTTTTTTTTTTEPDLICMIEVCDATGEEMIALLDESFLTENMDYPSRGRNFEIKSEGNLIPAIVCGKHFEKLTEAYCR